MFLSVYFPKLHVYADSWHHRCEYSKRFSDLIGGHNPIATLATLIWFSTVAEKYYFQLCSPVDFLLHSAFIVLCSAFIVLRSAFASWSCFSSTFCLHRTVFCVHRTSFCVRQLVLFLRSAFVVLLSAVDRLLLSAFIVLRSAFASW